MAGIANHKPNISLLRKRDSNGNVPWLGNVDCIANIYADRTRRIFSGPWIAATVREEGSHDRRRRGIAV